MATEEGAETYKIQVTPLQPRSSNLRTYSRKKSISKLPSLKPSQKQYPVKPPQQTQLNLRVTKTPSNVSKAAEPRPSNRIEVVIPDTESASFDPHDYDDAYVGEEEDEVVDDDVGGNEVAENYEVVYASEGDGENLNTTRRECTCVFLPPGAGEDVYNIPDDLPEDLPPVVPNNSDRQKKSNGSERQKDPVQVVMPSTTPHFTQQMRRGRPPGNGPRRPHLIFNKLPSRNRFKKLPQKSGRQTSALRSNPGDGFSDDEIKRSGLVLRRSAKQNTSITRVADTDIPRRPPLPRLKQDKRRADSEDSVFEIRPRKRTKCNQEQPDSIANRSTQWRSTPRLAVPTQILIPPLRQPSNPKARVIVHPPTSDEDEESEYSPDDRVIIPQSRDFITSSDLRTTEDEEEEDEEEEEDDEEEVEDEEEEEGSGYATYISETFTGGQRSSSVPVEPTVQSDSAGNGVDAGVQITQGLEERRGLKRSKTQ
ncbi:uncharacterized protein PODANS_6_1765 [Podospora anserina S mat+]|uniref:Podospora anserina S mat+ genomic DNA chromosome 6, supercontig 2 n=1 Tax=Podospora anserina (strain S / ATCC MYA-4624 / DSM 980 / FGSC 10383) TaxID=515849 RepID=B2B2X7_PODAN|nr:uncharacterized protein PODANS_6_1765 [Podospora anserina S mat+]CAP71463.1 unnamed protein product [Podospora anserina S mat+]